MKYLLMSLLLLIVIVSCQKEITDEISGTGIDTTIVITDTGKMEADIDSVHWVASVASAGFSTATPILPKLLNITGQRSDGSTITITLVDSGLHHIYTLNNTGMNAAAYSQNNSSTVAYTTNQGPDSVSAGTVEVTVDTINKTVSGTFSFTVYRQIDSTHKILKNGKFTNLPYVSGNVIPPASATDTFHVKINDTLFTPYSINGNFSSLTNTLILQGSDSLVTKTVGVNIPKNATGIHSFDLFTFMGSYTFNSNLQASSGTIEILENDSTTKRVRGNFDFHAKNLLGGSDSAVLSQGYFSIKYQ